MKAAIVGVLLAAVLVGTAVEGTDPCADAVTNKESGNYKNPESGDGLFGQWHCMTYYKCNYDAKTGKAKATKEYCWILFPLRQYDPASRECQWFWKAHCKASNPTPTPSPTSAPTTTPSTTAPTVPTTIPSTTAPTTTAPK